MRSTPSEPSRRRGQPNKPVTRALSLAFVLGLLGSGFYAVVIRGESLFHKLTGPEILTVLALIAVLWLMLWPIFAAVARHRAAVAAEPPPEHPPRPIAEMTSQELAEWAGDDPAKLRRLLRYYRSTG
jgi:hypothetical protein